MIPIKAQNMVAYNLKTKPGENNSRQRSLIEYLVFDAQVHVFQIFLLPLFKLFIENQQKLLKLALQGSIGSKINIPTQFRTHPDFSRNRRRRTYFLVLQTGF